MTWEDPYFIGGTEQIISALRFLWEGTAYWEGE